MGIVKSGRTILIYLKIVNKNQNIRLEKNGIKKYESRRELEKKIFKITKNTLN